LGLVFVCVCVRARERERETEREREREREIATSRVGKMNKRERGQEQAHECTQERECD